MFYILATVACAIVIIYKYLISTYDYWAKKNVPFHKPVLFFGTHRNAILMKDFRGQVYADLYRLHKCVPYVGLYKVRQPELLIRDPEIVRDVLVTNSKCFRNNSIMFSEEVDPVAAKHPIMMSGSDWKAARDRITPCFTTTKLKLMVPLIIEVSERMVNYIDKQTQEENKDFEIRDLVTRFMVDNSMSCGYAVNGRSFEHSNTELLSNSARIVEISYVSTFKFIMHLFFPSTAKTLRIKIVPNHVLNYFERFIKDTLKFRQENCIERDDFLNTQLKSTTEGFPSIYTDLAIQTIVYLIDAYETTSIVFGNCLYDIAKHTDVQQKIRAEIEKMLGKYENILTYETVQEMNYLDCVLLESLRLHTPCHIITRMTTSDYSLSPISDSDKPVIIEKGTPIAISVYSLHHDAKYFPNPEKFDPERFSIANKLNIIKGSYIPFSDGPRVCPGIF